ncbi:hypothetical protein HPP92_007126 [Vanilla planifolia]|uniref:Uncharacterized protein n=1 Tax=Vanilla planifolia TaxID=51239 RepID=A0A835RQ94_VANPL|nr:hypothetical protein HPP92_007368 [Vanilla planifolia]KAG0490263.1 hypothetical protein HPP92_007126 [Vanilla planifolia]
MISVEADRLASEVLARNPQCTSIPTSKNPSQISPVAGFSMEAVIFREGFVAEHKVLRLIELLDERAAQIDSVIADGDVKLQRRTGTPPI